MKWFYKLEYKYGRYAIRNLMHYLVAMYLVGLVLSLIETKMEISIYYKYLSLDPSMIFKGQVWRLVTFLICPPDSSIFFGLLECYIYWMLGDAVERAWGSFKFNVYIFSGILFSIIAVLIAYAAGGDPTVLSTANTMYLNFSLFMAFAFTFPDVNFLFMFLIPVPAKVMGIIELVVYAYLFLVGNLVEKIMIGVSLMNFLIFFALTRNNMNRFSPKEVKRRNDFKKAIRTPAHQIRHRCAVCGITEQDAGENIEFRYCSKCAGDFEYCSQHLYTHIHVTPESLEQLRQHAEKKKSSSGMDDRTKMIDENDEK